MALVLTINSVDRTAYVKWDTIQLTSVLSKEVDRLEFEIIKTPDKSSLPDVGDDIALSESGSKLFGGVIVEKNEVIKGGLLIGYQVRCKDYSQYLDRKVVTKAYGTSFASTVVLDIINTFTSGFTTVHVASVSPTMGSIKFNYEQPTRCLTQICDQIGWDWYVDPDKDIHFFSEESTVAPFNLDDTSDNFEWESLEINKSVLQLKNSVYVRGGEYKKTISEANAIDKYTAAAGQKTVYLAYKYDNVTVKKNGVVQVIGTDQQTDPATVDALYNFNEKFVTFSAALSGGDAIIVSGDAYIPIIAQARDATSISTYGEYQAALVDKSITSISEAQTRAKAELKKYAESTHELQFKTKRIGLRVGESITLNSTIRGWAKTFKINRIVAKARDSSSLIYTVYGIASGEISFTDIMVNLLGQDKKNITIASNEVLQRLEILNESVTVADTLTGTARSRPYLWGEAGSITSSVFSYALKEDGGRLLLETGDRLIFTETDTLQFDPRNFVWGFSTWN